MRTRHAVIVFGLVAGLVPASALMGRGTQGQGASYDLVIINATVRTIVATWASSSAIVVVAAGVRGP